MTVITKPVLVGVLLTFAATPAFAAKHLVNNVELDGISARASNQVAISGNSFLKGLMNSSNGSIQVGSYQWSDDHSTDGSNHKGANDQSGAFSRVQQNVTTTINALVWGAAAQVSTVNTAPVHGDQTTQAWATMFLGGF